MMYLITGATGFIGRNLVKELQARGNAVRILAMAGEDMRWIREDRAEIFTGDLLKADTLTEAARGADIVIHLAGVTHSFDKALYSLVNVRGTKNLLDACVKNNVKKIIYISTRAISELGGAYSVSKRKAEELIKKSPIDFTILRLAEVYGGNKDRGIEQLAGMIRSSRIIPVIGNGKFRLEPVYIKDVIAAIIAVCGCDKARCATYNIAGPDVLTYNELITMICKKLGVKRVRVHIPCSLALACAYLSYFLLKKVIFYPDQISRLTSPKEEDIEKAAEELNYRPVRFEDGLKLSLNDL